MNKAYNEPEFKVVKMIGTDVLTGSNFDDYTSGWETGSKETGGGTVPILNL